MLSVPALANIKNLKYSGMDSLEKCADKKFFLDYKKEISYNYNLRGFRDNEWPDSLQDVVWCVGDSFTKGVGQPFEETWPSVLSQKIKKTCLNISESGCSNDLIQLRVNEIKKLYNPRIIVIMWSYLHRRYIDGQNHLFDHDDFGLKNDIENFEKNYNLCKGDNVIHTIIPKSHIEEGALKYFLHKKDIDIFFFNQLDIARDSHHFGYNTSKFVCEYIAKKIRKIDNKSK